MKRVLIVGVMMLEFSAGVARADDCCSPTFGNFRATFVNRFEYATSSSSGPTDIQNKMVQLKNLGLTDVVFQVRGRADAYYNSQFEPRAEALTGNWDPLQTAINAAHANGLRLHAWINAMPLWNSSTLPASPNHIFYNTNPSFRIQYLDGTLQPAAGTGGYSIVNPILPEVHTHLNNVVNDIATHYNVDGINLDYIRYVSGTDFNVLPHDAISHQMFLDATGLDGSNPANETAYQNYVKSKITDLVHEIKNTIDAAEVATGRTMLLSADVWRDPDVGEHDYLQDYRTWLENDYLDIAQPMIYLSSSNDDALFAANLSNTLNIPTHAKIAPTLGVYLQNASGGGVALTQTEMLRTYEMGADGMGFYGYGALYTDSLASSRRTAITNFYNSLATLPKGPGSVIDDFEADEGHFNWSPTFSGSNVGINAGTADRVAGGAQTGGGAEKVFVDGTSNWTLRFLSGIGTTSQAGAPSGNLAIPATGYIGFWLKTSDPGISVQLALDDPVTADRTYLKSLIADGLWHLYQWNLEDDGEWSSFSSGDGSISGPTVTIDSIFFYGSGDATFYMDNISYNSSGLLAVTPVMGDYNHDGAVGPEDYTAWKSSFGQQVTPGSGEDGNGDGRVDAADYALWRDNLGASLASGAGAGGLNAAPAVPEPSTLLLAIGWLFAGCTCVRKYEHFMRENRCCFA